MQCVTLMALLHAIFLSTLGLYLVALFNKVKPFFILFKGI